MPMTLARFNHLISGTRIGQNKTKQKTGRRLLAMRLHLVDGYTVAEAAKEAGGISPENIYMGLKRIKRDLCPHCNQVMPYDQPRRK